MDKIEEKFYKDKYPDGYIQHYLAMYSVHQKRFCQDNFESQNRMYVDCEGKEEFLNLRNKVIKAKQQENLGWFLRMAIFYQIEDIDLESLNRMFEAIENFKV